jgi:hypothetical protein
LLLLLLLIYFFPFLEDWSFLFGKEETLFTCAHRRVL